MATDPDDLMPDFGLDEPLAPPPAAPVVRPAAPAAPVVRPAAPAAPTRRAPAAAIPPDPSATGVFPRPPAAPVVTALPRRAAPAPAPTAVPPHPALSRPVPPVVPPASTEAEYEDDEVEPRKGGLTLGRLALGTAVAALACAGVAKYGPDIKDVLRGEPVSQTTEPAPIAEVTAPTIPAPALKPQVGPDDAPVAPVAPAESSSIAWEARSDVINEAFTPAVSAELNSHGAKADVTLECNNGEVKLYHHELPGNPSFTVTNWNVSADGQSSGPVIDTNYGKLSHPWGTCDAVKNNGVTQWTAYLK